eukprot:TRINITY_DN6535_c0_g1_i1.p1 TRINITY_DN6535_c0_g1~~TRINITY_DN6535_c0_g1_i1.p1  ORF type:complete len:120 (+),score=5.98 TRINITY_DN6535_c0_g1_i1:201-560(+)
MELHSFLSATYKPTPAEERVLNKEIPRVALAGCVFSGVGGIMGYGAGRLVALARSRAIKRPFLLTILPGMFILGNYGIALQVPDVMIKIASIDQSSSPLSRVINESLTTSGNEKNDGRR